MDPGFGAIRMHSLPLNLKVLSLPEVLLCVSYVCMGAALPRLEAGDLRAQLITATCPASLSLGLQEGYSWLLSLSLPWGVSDPWSRKRSTGQLRLLQAAASVPGSRAVILTWPFCRIQEHVVETGCGG